MEEKKKHTAKIAILIASIFVIFISVAYAFLNQTLTGTKRQVITAGNLQLELKEDTAITLVNAMPMYDEVGMIQDSYDFTLTNKTDENADYTLTLKDVTAGTNKLDTSLVKYGLTKDGAITKDLLSNLENNVIDSGTLPGNGTVSYSLRLWIDSNVEDESLIKDKNLSYKIEINATLVEKTQYVDAALNGCDPVLGENLVPVTITNNGTVTMASVSEAWYDYANKEWANAVVLEDTAGTYNSGDTIPESAIESYFVWIPRYKYKIFNDGNYTELTSLNPDAPQTIEIEFENKDTTPSNGTAKDEWLSHPAFQAFDTNGFWVGKFESGYRDATTTTEAQVTAADATKLVIKPNIYSWRNMNLGNMFKTSYDYLRDSESHMMKNIEWGAVAYLSHSQYGVDTEIYINNNSNHLTGCGGDSASAESIATCTNAYGSKVDGIYNQTTTGNISGVFDMSGGAHEYVMGYNASAEAGGEGSGITDLYGEFFTDSKWEKYYDKYTSNSYTAYSNRILGDATGEMGPFDVDKSSWYDDYARFVTSSNAWFLRGGAYGNASSAGISNFAHNTGGSNTHYSFRLAMSPQ